ncbi:uncharacterized protein PHACADRAFT_205061 [Phanerochaete carnosa HHB-10118-sp]|uniref:Amine oxidase domain-containing protein n=1 Tax=Phanerochaete carnosa (strain HHB-10118-sp) TaxID=650164 RepID=K5V7U3_PHACS|nr:uncharacterized protein PHACADRAFT_205061 [Phanerochaete carnosa HHB-10118-sp]EKM58811.1 hypothetical protein PHACADRAFT_205061 [Phanerochaete carnosa HHB-10118-sp]
MAQTTASSFPSAAGDPVNHYAQNVIKNFHRELETPSAAPQQSEARPRTLSFDADKYLRPAEQPIIPVPSSNLAEQVGIIGGGIGGLYAALLLRDAGIPSDIYEASDRLGGRLFTYKFPQSREYDYFDVGAMRFPDTPAMKPVFDLFKRLDVKTLKYYFKDKLGNSTLFYNDIVKKRTDESKIVPKDFNITGLPDKWGSLGVEANMSNVIKPFKDGLIKDAKEHSEKGWELMMEYDRYSTRGYMSDRRSDYRPDLDEKKLMPYPVSIVEWCETFDGSSTSFDRALTESVLDSLAFAYDDQPIDWHCIDGGSSRLADKLAEYLESPGGPWHRVYRNNSVTGIRYHKGLNIVGVANGRGTTYYTHVITTTTLPCLRAMDLSEAGLDYPQKNALRALYYSSATKIGVKFKTAWWQDDAVMKKYGGFGAIVGGQSYTDNMSRMIVYPSYSAGSQTPSTVLIASYAWTGDALAWTGLMQSEDRMRRRLLDDLAEVHRFNANGRKFLEDQVESIYPYSWNNDPNTMGSYAFFGPGDFSDLYPHLTRPAAKGRLHFAGEVASARHAWVVGALEASKLAVHRIISSSYPEKLEEFEKKWGLPEAWTRESIMKQVAVTLEGVYADTPLQGEQ